MLGNTMDQTSVVRQAAPQTPAPLTKPMPSSLLFVSSAEAALVKAALAKALAGALTATSTSGATSHIDCQGLALHVIPGFIVPHCIPSDQVLAVNELIPMRE
mmetsp:Transcript_59807/g.115387  ORF Transcript_59807/g.115387 Transcript_59807/m.115387 type:complete len:102 (+) Transcript_59807:174-479(+)